MSAAPDTPRGRETERLMLLWRKQNPGAEASAYNREWESVYRKLEFLDGEELTQAKLDWFWNHLHEMGFKTLENMSLGDHEKLAKAFFTSRIQFESGRQRGFPDGEELTHHQQLRDHLHKALFGDSFGYDIEHSLHLTPHVEADIKRLRLTAAVKRVRPATKGAFGKPEHLRRR